MRGEQVESELYGLNDASSFSWLKLSQSTLAVRGKLAYGGPGLDTSRPGMLHVVVTLDGVKDVENDPRKERGDITLATFQVRGAPSNGGVEFEFQHEVPLTSLMENAAEDQLLLSQDALYAFAQPEPDEGASNRRREITIVVYALDDGDGFPATDSGGEPDYEATRYMRRLAGYRTALEYKWLDKTLEDARYAGSAVEFGEGEAAQAFLEGAVHDPAKAVVVAVQHSPYDFVPNFDPVPQPIEGHGGDQEDALLIVYEALEEGFQAMGGSPEAAWDSDSARVERGKAKNEQYTRFYDRWLNTITDLMSIWLRQWNEDKAARGADSTFVARLDEVTSLVLPTYQYYVTKEPWRMGAEQFVADYNHAAAWQKAPLWTIDESMRTLAAAQVYELESAEALEASGGEAPDVAKEEDEDAKRESDDR